MKNPFDELPKGVSYWGDGLSWDYNWVNEDELNEWREKWEPKIILAMAIAKKVSQRHTELVEEYNKMSGIELAFSSSCELNLLEDLLRV